MHICIYTFYKKILKFVRVVCDVVFGGWVPEGFHVPSSADSGLRAWLSRNFNSSKKDK